MEKHFSPKELAEALGVSESSVKRWSDAGKIGIQRTIGGHRRIPIAEAVRFVRRTRHPLSRPELLGLPADTGGDVGGEGDALFRMLRDGQESQAADLLCALYARGWNVDRIVDGPFRDAMNRLGELWIDDAAGGILLEHRATRQAIVILQALRGLLDPPDDPQRLALGAALSGDPYLLPTMAVSVVLESIGYRTHDLGPHTPVISLCRAIEEFSPNLVWISETSREIPRRDLEAVRRVAERNGAVPILGGQLRPVSKGGSVLLRMETLTELTAFARGLAVGRDH